MIFEIFHVLVDKPLNCVDTIDDNDDENCFLFA